MAFGSTKKAHMLIESKLAIRLLLVTWAYFATGWLGLQMPYLGQHITLLWLPTGIALAALHKWGRPVWPGVFMGAFLVNLSVGSAWPVALGIALGNALAPMLAAEWLRLRGFHAGFDRQRDVGLFAVATILGMLVSASGGVTCLYLAGVMSIESVSAAWLFWWMGDTVGALLAGSLLLSLTHKNLAQLGSDRKALLLWLTFAIPVAWFAFMHDYVQIGRSLPLAFLTLPLFAWAALQFGSTGAALAGMAFSTVAAWSTATGHGTFALPDTQASLLLLWLYMASTVLTGLLITAMQAERLQAQSTLRESQLNLAITLNSIGDAVIATDAAGLISRMNPTAERLTGWPLADAMGRALTEVFCIIDAQTRQPSVNPVQRVMAHGKVVGLANHTALLARDGREYQISDSAAPIRNADGQIVGIVLVFSDVSSKYRAEEALLKSEKCLNEAQRMAKVGNWELDLLTNRLTWSDEIFRLFEIDKAQFAATYEAFLSAIHPDDREAVNSAYSRSLESRAPYAIEHRLLFADGRIKYVREQCESTFSDTGQPLRSVGTVQDITESKLTEKTILELNRNFVSFLENTTDFIYFKDQDSRFHFCSQTLADITGHASWRDMIGKHDLEVFPKDIAQIYHEEELPIFRDGVPLLNKVDPYHDRSGKQGWVSTNKWPLLDRDGKVVGLFGISRDITEQKQVQEALQQSLKDKQALLNEVHHRVKNNLQVIVSLLRLEKGRSRLTDTKAALTDMQGRIQSMALLHESLYRTGIFASIELGSYLRSLATQTFRGQASSSGTVRLAVDFTPVQVSMDLATPCGLLVNELISNCLKHGFSQGNSGEVKLELQPVNPENLQIDAQWRLCVSDNGVGLPPDFDAKSMTSLGLQLVGDLSRQMDGNLAIQSQAGAGAKFTVIFKIPAVGQPVTAN